MKDNQMLACGAKREAFVVCGAKPKVGWVGGKDLERN